VNSSLLYGLGERVFHIAFSVLTRPPCFQIFPEAGPAWETSRVSEFGPALNEINHLGPGSKSGVPLENPFAETRRPCQIWGVPTQKGEASFFLGIEIAPGETPRALTVKDLDP
jgi:hypothetical protein